SYKLQASSPAIDSGESLLPIDYQGAARPVGAAWDLGAYEYGASATRKITPAFIDAQCPPFTSRSTPLRLKNKGRSPVRSVR
ncbi:MAG TPA: choice-of-anchor Q domain-containing protein, partial [Stenomitos sp.]